MSAPPTGLYSGLKASGATLLDILKTRLDLLGNELQFEKQRILRLLGWGLALVFFAGVGMLLLVAFLALWLWDYRLWVLGLSLVVFAGVAVICVRSLKATLDEGQAPFSATVAELQNDINLLRQTLQSTGKKP
jgi:uncharacterized membrane protein YqjE